MNKETNSNIIVCWILLIRVNGMCQYRKLKLSVKLKYFALFNQENEKVKAKKKMNYILLLSIKFL